MRVPGKQRSHRRFANVTTPDAASTPIDDDRKLELKTRCSRQMPQCEASLERGSFSEVLDFRTTGRGDELSADEAL
ncbi:MAG TPA: hypothetical protein VN743_01545 [Blastocatellia bacterium]|nr:hypothetical protein [Blastocatellia bacterium]